MLNYGPTVPAFDTTNGDELGIVTVRQNSDGSTFMGVRGYNATGAALTKGVPTILTYGTSGQTIKAMVPIASGQTGTPAVGRHLGVAAEAIPVNGRGWFALEGYIDANVNASTAILNGDFLKLPAYTDGTALIKDNPTHGGTLVGNGGQTLNSVAVAQAGLASGTGSLRIYMIGRAALIAA